MSRIANPYEVLGVARDAPQEDIRRAYLKLAHKYHPDKTGGDKAAEERLKEINSAYDMLKTPEKRAQFDRYGAEGNPFGGGGGFSGGGGGFEAPFEDFFDMLFGQGGGRRRRGGPQAGDDLELRLDITLEEAAFGARKELRFNRNENCSQCSGSGAAPGTRPETCPQCNGAGQVRIAHGYFSVTRTCPKCSGAGQTIGRACKSCGGAGRSRQQRTLNLDIPAGVETGSRLRVSGEGEPGAHNGPRGDLYVLISVAAHPLFHRDGANIVCELPVSVVNAALGATVRVPTLKGEAELKVPAGTQSGAQFRLRGLGLPSLRGYSQGDQIVRVVVETPASLTGRQKELLREFESLSSPKNHPLQRAFSERARRND